MSAMEEKLRGVAKRGSRHGPRATGPAASDWPAASGSGGGGRGQATPSSSQPGGSAYNRGHESPSRRQSSRDSVEPTGQQAPPEHGELLFKVMLLGDSGVGKTCLLTRFRDGRFLSGNYITTVGIDFRNKVVVVDDTSIKLQIWDTAGQERFRSVTHAYYRDAHALLLLYDVTNKTSYDNIRAWLSEIREHANEDVVIMLLGNKSDCGTERVVKREDGERLAQEYKVPFMETSAKTGLNVELAFLAVARELKARKSNDPDDTKFNVQDYVRQQSQRNSCFNSNCLTT
ncbi:ras-related protein Rab-37-like isoform X3 [Apis laboriosa]|uniref:ras-related protein Rab-37-like isoform X3 n=1 Tax=Apis laboriosa TaxID=183418 RepID=UPI001CC5E4CD|nr:ras-related protein Rab-37-like isoform X3 [Apis laboriosa]